MAGTSVEDVASALKDAAYVSVGLGLLAFQRLQVRRKQLERAFKGSVDDTSGGLEIVAAHLGERAKMIEERLGATLRR